MSVYNKSGLEIYSVYDVNGQNAPEAYNISGDEILNGVTPRDWSGMSSQYKTNVNTVSEIARAYINEHNSSFAFPVLTDVHDQFTGNEPNYVMYHYPSLFDKFLFLGDIANAYSQTQLNNAVNYMSGAETANLLVLVGNHELGGFAEGDTLPRAWYAPLLNENCVIKSGESLTYYYDDLINNVRFICLDSCTPIKKSAGTQLFNKDDLEFCASALETSGNKDIIVLNHAMGSGFYLVTDTEKTDWKYDTNITNASTIFWPLLNAYINRGTYTFSDESGVSHTHDFSSLGGNVIGYFTGHYHNPGFYDGNGFNMFTLPSSYFNSSGLSVIIIDKSIRKIIWLIAYRNQNYGQYEYTY